MISAAQRILLQGTLWPKAARLLGRDPKDRAARLAWLSEVVGREITSANDLNRTDEFSKVIDAVGILAGRLKSALREVKPKESKAENKRWFIRHEQLPCLALYCEDGRDGAERLLAEIIKDKFHHGSRVEPLTLDDLDDAPRFTWSRSAGRDLELPSQLAQIVMTLGRLIQQRRKSAGDTLHDMRTRAGLKCECKECCLSRRAVFVVSPQGEVEVPEFAGVTGENEPF